MTYLLDSQVIIWAVSEPGKLIAPVLEVFESDTAVRQISAISFWEIEIKREKGKLKFDVSFERILSELAATELPVSARHVQALRALPSLHNDPFDRMLVA
jgi:PIN domain nuclease of toxin-antitoxin system